MNLKHRLCFPLALALLATALPVLGPLTAKAEHQQTLLSNAPATARTEGVMATLDALNRRFGAGRLRIGASGTTRPWAMRAENRSPRYTTRWDELAEVRAG